MFINPLIFAIDFLRMQKFFQFSLAQLNHRNLRVHLIINIRDLPFSFVFIFME